MHAHRFTDNEMLAFNPGITVPGIMPSDDKLLQGRIFSYSDTQRYRLGANYQNLPINRCAGFRHEPCCMELQSLGNTEMLLTAQYAKVLRPLSEFEAEDVLVVRRPHFKYHQNHYDGQANIVHRTEEVSNGC